ncbi:ER lumen protein-retaining receptor A-like [Lotus japonicus]|uniref:ER lumen protein-retaining receptor A-like n=1 Tax=Lotus japonicus TaxID=34305 RepID=UPI002589DF84|nr:ER lumen protein-retaining receptor A-like [Lotus japonicus]
MGTKKDSPMMNVLFEWLRKGSKRVKIILGAFLLVFAIVALKLIYNPIYFFIASRSIHFVGIIVLIHKLFSRKTCSGLSLKTQEITALSLLTRLSFDLLMVGNIYALLDFITLVATLLVIWAIRFKLKSSYAKEFDSLRRSFVVVPCAILAVLIHPYSYHYHLNRISWAFSSYLRAVSVLPQLHYLQNAKMVETLTGYYVFALGISRFLLFAHWVIQCYENPRSYLRLVENGSLWLIISLLSELVQTFILADFCYYYMKSFIQGQLLRKMPI